MESNIEKCDLDRTKSILGPILQNPTSSALFFDLDGTLAPIAPSPEAVALPVGVNKKLAAVACRYRLVACISGRRADTAKAIVGLEEITYIGNHGIETIKAGSDQTEISEQAKQYNSVVKALVTEQYSDELASSGVRLEDKDSIQVLHWRGAEDEKMAVARLTEVADASHRAGLAAKWGRKVLEIGPPVELNKGTAVTALLDATAVKFALYAGDDRTDLDAFEALHRLKAGGSLEDAVCVGVSSSEGPREIVEAADLVASGCEGVAEILDMLAQKGGS